MEKIAITLSQIHEQFKESTTNRNQIETKERADTIKQKIIFFSNDLLSRRKDLFWKRLRNQKTADLYEIYLEKNFVPRKFRTKLPNSYTEKEKELLGNLAIDKVKHEIIILKNRSSEFKEQYEAIDTKILMKIHEETADHATIENLKKFSVEGYEKEEEGSLAIWNKKEEEFKQIYDKDIEDKVDLLTKKQDFNDNFDQPNNMKKSRGNYNRQRSPSPRPLVNRRAPSLRPFPNWNPTPLTENRRSTSPRPLQSWKQNRNASDNNYYNGNHDGNFNNNFKESPNGNFSGNRHRNYGRNYDANYDRKRKPQNRNFNRNYSRGRPGNFSGNRNNNNNRNFNRNYNGNYRENHIRNFRGNHCNYNVNMNYNDSGWNMDQGPRNINRRPHSRVPFREDEHYYSIWNGTRNSDNRGEQGEIREDRNFQERQETDGNENVATQMQTTNNQQEKIKIDPSSKKTSTFPNK